ncbi:hypothetical protein V6N11_058326 [Hibiscus sabdariffa]|uniref:CCHC-type domain-containing protein n=1 Tax=Hibiscus sabdariffa TaxID=183260 RepID=A0ABR2U3Y2_9ROSI
MCPLQYERLPLFCHGCGLLGHAVLSCPTTPQSDVQKLQYGAWMRAPKPKRPTASRPRGCVTLIHDDMEVPAPTPSAASGSPTVGASDPLSSGTGDNPTTPVSTVPSDRPVSPALAPADNEHGSYDPVVHSATSDMLEDALAVPSDCALLVDIDGIIKSHGADLVDEAIDAAADTLIRDVAASVLGCLPPSVGTDAAAAPATSAALPAAPATSAAIPAASPTAPGLSRSAPACARRLPMPALPEH